MTELTPNANTVSSLLVSETSYSQLLFVYFLTLITRLIDIQYIKIKKQKQALVGSDVTHVRLFSNIKTQKHNLTNI